MVERLVEVRHQFASILIHIGLTFEISAPIEEKDKVKRTKDYLLVSEMTIY